MSLSDTLQQLLIDQVPNLHVVEEVACAFPHVTLQFLLALVIIVILEDVNELVIAQLRLASSQQRFDGCLVHALLFDQGGEFEALFDGVDVL